MNDWFNIDYLQSGTPRQRAAFHCLHKLGILQKLKKYRAVLVSTICIDIDIESSDLDIICQINDPIKFIQQITTLYGKHPNFNLFEIGVENNTVVAEFEFENFMIEVFAQPVVVEEQAAYQHLSVMARLLSFGGEAMRESIRELKRKGLKSEPAFACYLGLNGDPYQALLELNSLSDDQLLEITANNKTQNRNINTT